MSKSELSGFRRLDVEGRRARVAELTGLNVTELDALSPDRGLDVEQAGRMVENLLGVLGVPLGLCVHARVNERDYLVPMATEEPSVVAAASYAGKLLRAGGGVHTEVSAPLMIGQIQLLDVADPKAAESALLGARAELLELANGQHPHLVAAGGGAVDVEVRHLPCLEPQDPVGDMVIVHLVVDVRDAMGANVINAMCERLAPRIADLAGGRVGLRILSNLCDRRLVRAWGRVPLPILEGRGAGGAAPLARQIVEASVFAERDPYRATTHNKGIMNGVDAVLIALGQDFRAVEAGAHAYAARSGRYTALGRWRIVGGHLRGELTLPMAVGTVGGVSSAHPAVRVARRIAQIDSAAELAGVVAAVGLAQNLSALRALAAEGIQAGHMRLHARNVAAEAGALGDEIDEVARLIADRGTVTLSAAKEVVAERDRSRREASRIPDVYLAGGQGALLERFEHLRDRYWPPMQELVQKVVDEATPAESSLLGMFGYHMKTGGKRLRALLPLLVADALGADPQRMVALGAACELMHNAILVHDDVQDGDLVRRGRMTVWNRFGVPQAIDLGDAMLYYAALLCQHIDASVSRRESIARRLLVETLRVLDGQERGHALKIAEAPSLEAYFHMVEHKTSGMFALPMAGAAELCGASAEVVAGLDEAARHMGVLFQIQDDSLDLYADHGHEAYGSDIAEGKRTLLVMHALRHLDGDQARRLTTVLDKDRSATTRDDVRKALAVLEECGALRHALAEMRRRKELALAVAAVAEHPRLRPLVTSMCDLFIEAIVPLAGRDPAPTHGG